VYTQSGTPPYQAPDAGLNRWDVSTDLFAVGVVLYELLCDGRHPYPAGKAMVDCEVVDPRTIRTNIDEQLAAFVRRACAAGRAERFATALEMQHELRKIRAEL
jgi:serine/threonine protein kinase